MRLFSHLSHLLSARGWAAILLMGCLGAGCIHQVIKPRAEATLIITRANDMVKLGWQSEKNAIYDVMYADNLKGNERWQVLPQGAHIRGTGNYMNLTDVIPTDVARYYRLQIIPAQSH